MTTIALIGLDGSGKTTLANRLLEDAAVPIKYLYMGTAIGSSNYALPTSRLAHYLKDRGSRDPQAGATTGLRTLKKRDTRGKFVAVLRLLHRLSEEWYRQLISWIFQLRGFVVLYDRHFIFECAPRTHERSSRRRFSDRVHFWMLTHMYPKPDLILFLDAPPKVLFERKPEASLDYLSARREDFLALGRQMKNFIRMDATQSIESVVAEAQEHIRWASGLDTPNK